MFAVCSGVQREQVRGVHVPAAVLAVVHPQAGQRPGLVLVVGLHPPLGLEGGGHLGGGGGQLRLVAQATVQAQQ